MYRLIIEDDEGRTTIVPLIRNQIRIGREEGNTIRLTERNISRKHAKLLLKNGQIMVEDLKSYNGVWINGSRIEGRAALRPGDLLEIGDYHLSVQEEASEAEQSTRPSLPPDQDFDDQTPPIGMPPIQESEAEAEGMVAPESATLLLLNTSERGATFDVEWPAVMIGRTDENEVAIDHASVSRHHAKIVCENGVYKLYDLDSANGVQVNGQEFKVCDLRWGDIIELGQIRFRFCAANEDLSQFVSAPETPAMPPAVTPAPSSSLNVVLALAVVLVLAGGGGIYYFLNKGPVETPPPPRLRDRDHVSAVPVRSRKSSPAQQDAERRREQESQLKLADDLFAQENYNGALTILARLLKQRPNWKKALELKKRSEYENKHFKLIQESIELQAEGKMYDSYQKLAEVSKESRYFARAEDARRQIAAKAVEELLQKVRQSIADKRYFEAIQFNSKALDILPKHDEANAIHKKLEKLTAPSRRASPPRGRTRTTSSRKLPPKPPKIRRQQPLARDTSPPKDAGDGPPLPSLRRRPVPPRNSSARCESLFLSARYQLARRCFQKLLRRKGDKAVPEAHLFLGQIAEKRGRCLNTKTSLRKPLLCLQARYHYNQFLRLRPGSPEAIRLKTRLQKAQSTAPAPRRKPIPR